MNALPVRSAQQTPRLLPAVGLGLALGVVLGFVQDSRAAESPGDWRITLLKPKDCQACVYLEESLKRHGTLQQVALNDGAGHEATAAIERRPGGDVTTGEWQELLQLPYFDPAIWKQHAAEHAAQVLLKRDGRVVAAGNISESADLRGMSYPADLTLPLVATDVERIRAGYTSFYQSVFIENWNFDWFFRLARDPAQASARRFDHWVEKLVSPAPPALGVANVLLASTGTGATDNPIFNAIRSEEIEQVLTQDLGVDRSRIQVRYGAGLERGFNAVEQTPSGLRYVRRDVPRAEAFTIQSLASFFEGVRAHPASRNLLVLIGHGGPDGVPLWGQLAPLGPEEMQGLHARGQGEDLLVSGACFGGVLAATVSCGFFSARPDTIATGCQADAAEVAQSQDYLHVYFEAFTPAKRALADADGDGRVSFEEAHWYATRYGDPRNITYSTVDALAERWFDAHATELPQDISLAELQQLAAEAGPAESETLKAMTRGLTGSHRFPLADLAGQAIRFSAVPSGPRPMLGQLARRLLYVRRAGHDDPALAAARSCGAQIPAAFLHP